MSNNKLIIVYHKDCMDGVSSAFIVREAWKLSTQEIITIPLQYGKEDELNNVNMDKNTYVIFADFSLKRHALIDLSKKVNCITIFDHHKTVQAELINLPENIDVVSDMKKSGATICLREFGPYMYLKPEIFEYIQDRDIWEWKLPHSREVSEYLKLKVIPNDIDSFATVYESFHLEEAVEIGKNLLQYQEHQVQAKIHKAKDIVFEGVEMKVINATENISELGNAICNQYNKPTMMYFITDDNSVICSMRSLDTLADVSIIATKHGGGGHRNACGFKTTLEHLASILGATVQISNTYKVIVRDPKSGRQSKKHVYESREKYERYGSDITERALQYNSTVEHYQLNGNKWELLKTFPQKES